MSPPEPSPATAITRHELDNGLVVFLQRAPSASVTFSATWLGEGGTARDPEGREGTSSAAARLLQAGTRRRSKRDLARELDRLASSFSARASWERLEVEASGPQDAEEEVLDLMFEALTAPRFDAQELSRVRREMREALLREATQPDERVDRAFLETLLPEGHPYRRNPLGSPRSLRSLRREDLVRFHRRHLTPEGSKLVLTTHTPAAEALRLLRRSFGRLTGPSALPTPEVPETTARGGPQPIYLEVPGTTQAEVLIGGAAPVRTHPDYPALALLDQILGGRSVLSRLFQVVREQQGLAYGAGSELECLAWSGIWMADAGTTPKQVRQVHALLVEEVRRLAERGPGPAEVKTIRESYLGSLPLLLETSTQAHGLAVEVAYFDLPLDHFASWPRTLRSLTPAELKGAAHRHLLDGGWPLGIAVGPPP